jgi:hypothetical protein
MARSRVGLALGTRSPLATDSPDRFLWQMLFEPDIDIKRRRDFLMSSPNAESQSVGGRPESDGVLDLFKRAAEASLVLAATLYVVGWSYLDGYYSTFALKIGQLGVSNEEAALSSFRFIFGSRRSILSFWIALTLFVLFSGFLYGRLKGKRDLLVVFFFLGLLAISGYSSTQSVIAGREAGLTDMLAATSHLPRVEIEVDREKISDNLVSYLDLGNKEYRLLLQTEGRVFVFKPPATIEGVMSVVSFPRESVGVVAVERAVPKEQPR